MSVSYGSYLQLDQILSAQDPVSAGPEHDEMLFIIVHQVYELWFKQILHELGMVQQALEHNDKPNTFHGLERILTILKTLVGQIDILETMTPVSFNSFRDRLESASGFQSAQFRELEFRLGKKDPTVLARFAQNSRERERLERALNDHSLWRSFLIFLRENKQTVPPASLLGDVRAPTTPSADVQTVLLAMYRQRSTLMQVCERLVDMDEGLQEWRYRHIKMVERTIGFKSGTGGSSGVEYLKSTLFKPFFPDLWQMRSQL